jgi:hypothetical protein
VFLIQSCRDPIKAQSFCVESLHAIQCRCFALIEAVRLAAFANARSSRAGVRMWWLGYAIGVEAIRRA